MSRIDQTHDTNSKACSCPQAVVCDIVAPYAGFRVGGPIIICIIQLPIMRLPSLLLQATPANWPFNHDSIGKKGWAFLLPTVTPEDAKLHFPGHHTCKVAIRRPAALICDKRQQASQYRRKKLSDWPVTHGLVLYTGFSFTCSKGMTVMPFWCSS